MHYIIYGCLFVLIHKLKLIHTSDMFTYSTSWNGCCVNKSLSIEGLLSIFLCNLNTIGYRFQYLLLQSTGAMHPKFPIKDPWASSNSYENLWSKNIFRDLDPNIYKRKIIFLKNICTLRRLNIQLGKQKLITYHLNIIIFIYTVYVLPACSFKIVGSVLSFVQSWRKQSDSRYYHHADHTAKPISCT